MLPLNLRLNNEIDMQIRQVKEKWFPELLGDVLPSIDGPQRQTKTLKVFTPDSTDKDGNLSYFRRTIKVVKNKPVIPYDRGTFEKEDNFFISDAEYMSAPSAEIMYGTPHAVIDEQDNKVRMLIEEETF